MNDYDAIIIGSGAGGLTAAVALAQAGKRVCVLEQHYLPGGWCHSFSLGGYRFSPGVHYLGELHPEGRLRRIYEGLGLGGDLSFYELNPDALDHILIGDERFDIPKGKEAFAERLAQRCPKDAQGIRRFLDTIGSFQHELEILGRAKTFAHALATPWRTPNLLRWSWRSARSMIDHHVRDPFARAVLAAQSGDHGAPPSAASAIVHGMTVSHYFDGGYYPKGGAASIPRAYLRALRRAGGEIHVRTKVEKILVERGRAIGVSLPGGETLRATHIISNADPHVTYLQLLDPAHIPSGLRRKLTRTRYSISCLSLFGATDLDLSAMGIDSGNYWLYGDTNIDAAYRAGLDGRGPGKPAFFFTATTLKDPSKRYPGKHTFESFTFVDYESYRRWEAYACGQRPDDYARLKEQLTRTMLHQLERVVPGLEAHTIFSNLGTPLTNRHYVAATGGSLYGTAKTPGQVGPLSYSIRTPIQNLSLCGASTVSHGVLGAAMSGLFAARRVLGCRLPELLQAKGGEITLLDHPPAAQSSAA